VVAAGIVSMRVPFLDLRAQARDLGTAVADAVGEVLASQQCVLGPHLERFERAMAEYARVPHAIGVGSGTDALALALAALDVGPGQVVATTAFTFFATASTIVRLGARPLFVDVDPRTLNLDPAALARALDAAPAGVVGIVPVHLYGRLAPMGELRALAAARGLWLVEDAAQAVGASSPWGRAGALGRAGCLSFYPTKNLGGIGDGGMVLTGDEEVARRVRRDRNQGMIGPYLHESVGLCSRLDAVQAAALAAKLPFLDDWNARRRAIAARYTLGLGAAGLCDGPDAPVTPPEPDGAAHVFHQYVIRARTRDRLAAHLAERGIGTQVYYPVPLHRQAALARHALVPRPLVETERAAAEVLALPIYPQLHDADVDLVVEAIGMFYRG
jgi:dTDP-4-amino-4,6-dideoxygalactose transaminase